VGNGRGEGGGGGGEGKAGEGKGKGEGKGEGKEGTPKVWLTPPMFEILKNTLVSIMITMQNGTGNRSSATEDDFVLVSNRIFNISFLCLDARIVI